MVPRRRRGPAATRFRGDAAVPQRPRSRGDAVRSKTERSRFAAPASDAEEAQRGPRDAHVDDEGRGERRLRLGADRRHIEGLEKGLGVVHEGYVHQGHGRAHHGKHKLPGRGSGRSRPRAGGRVRGRARRGRGGTRRRRGGAVASEGGALDGWFERPVSFSASRGPDDRSIRARRPSCDESAAASRNERGAMIDRATARFEQTHPGWLLDPRYRDRSAGFRAPQRSHCADQSKYVRLSRSRRPQEQAGAGPIH